MTRRVATDVRWHWAEDACMFDCPCGAREVICIEGEAVTCACGRVYRYVCQLVIEADGDR